MSKTSLRKMLAKRNKGLLKIAPAEEDEMLDAIRKGIDAISTSGLEVRVLLRNYINRVGERKARFNRPSILLEKLGIDKNAENMSYLYKLIRAVHTEYVLNLETGKVPYSVLSALPKKNLVEVWQKAKELNEDRPYPSENDIAKVKKSLIDHERALTEAEEDAYLEDICDDSKDRGNKFTDQAPPDLMQDILDLSRDSPKKTGMVLNVFEHFNEKELLKILAIIKNFTSAEISKMIAKLQKECRI